MLNVKADLSEVLGMLGTLKKESRKVAANTLTRTAYQLAKEDWPEIAEKRLDRPTPFTKRGARYKKATIGNLTAEVSLAPIQEKYLLPSLAGARIRKATPARIRLNKYGNIPSLRGGKKVQALLARRDHFRATINGTDAIWKRRAKGIEPVILFDRPITITKQLDFHQEMSTAARRRIKRNAEHELRRAMAKARRYKGTPVDNFHRRLPARDVLLGPDHP